MQAPSRRSAKPGTARRTGRGRLPGGPPAEPDDLSWLDAPIRSLGGRGRALNPKLAWFTDLLPGRARTAILKAARGELRALRHGGPEHLPALRTLREFITLPTRTLLLQPWYAHKTHSALCRAFRDCGITTTLFSGDEDHLPRF